MATRREEVIVGIGGDAKALMKELNMSKQQLKSWGAEIGRELSNGSIPEAWRGYTKNVREALNKTDEAAKTTAGSMEKTMSGAAVKIVAAFLGLNGIKKIFNEINASMKEVSENIGKFNNLDVAGVQQQRTQEKYSGLSEADQIRLVGAQVQKTGLFDSLKLQAAKLGALATTSFFTYAGMAKGKGFDESLASVSSEQKQIFAEAKALKLKQDGLKLIEKTVKDERERVRLREQYIKLVEAEHEAWRKNERMKEQVAANRRANEKAAAEAAANVRGERAQIAGDYNLQATLENLPGNPERGERRNREQAELIERIRAYGAQKPKTLRERLQDQIAARGAEKMTAQDAINKLAAVVSDDAMKVKVQLAK